MVSPFSRRLIVRAPSTTDLRFPLYLANRMENEVSGISSGTSRATCSKAWLSVMTRAGFCPRASKVCRSSVSLVTMETAPASRISRMVCCCGRIRRPLGAALSMGITRTTRSDGRIRSPTIRSRLSSAGTREAIRSFNSWILVWSAALTHSTESSVRPAVEGSAAAAETSDSRMPVTDVSLLGVRSALFITIT